MLVDIICGFLGAGKTTLINKLITVYKKRGEKIVIIENEYGSVNIDKYLFEDENIGVYEMTSGCLCCTLKGNLELSLQEIRDHIKPDRVIIEPSGIFVIDEMLSVFNTIDFQMFKLNQIITVVDSMHFMRYRHKYNALLGVQIKQAHVIVVSKISEQGDRKVLKNEIRIFNSKAPIIMKPWEDLGMDELEQIVNKMQSTKKFSSRKIRVTSAIIYQKHEIIPHQFTTETLQAEKNYSREAFEILIKDLEAKAILRCKGFINIEEKNYLFQYVDGTYSLEETVMPIKDHTLVLIGNM
ncbi:CobW family GTP-binding protein [Cellulosilyticum sp. I15G10I2]|uniref:CobW family GTP-binding protein n=1 Tax=Cellulosilyticum sp. I15G10I2 TaxID=1892843 RepID=UPI00085CC3B2|nr:CobW family GTP-binding protein [Cellulosilyticum sp. I15G10I2]